MFPTDPTFVAIDNGTNSKEKFKNYQYNERSIAISDKLDKLVYWLVQACIFAIYTSQLLTRLQTHFNIITNNT